MKNGKFKVGTVIKGRDLKDYILCKILSEDLVMRGFQYKIGMNEDVNQLAVNGSCKAGLHFCLIKDVCCFLDYGNRLAVISIPDDEDVYVDNGKFRTHRLNIERVIPLDKTAAWKYLCESGVDITAQDNCAICHAAEKGYLEIVKYLHENGADITAWDNLAVKCAADNGHLEIVKYLHKNGASITVNDNDAVISASENGHLEVVKYLYENGVDITVQNNLAIRHAAENGHLEIMKYLYKNGADITEQEDRAIRIAAKKGHLEIVKYLQENMQ